MHFKFIIILLVITHMGFCQYNFVTNGDFETHGVLQCSPTAPTGLGKQNALQDYWHTMWPWNVPELDQVNNWAFFSVGSPDYRCYGGIKGQIAGFGGKMEYLVAPLKKPLELGKYYYVEYYFLNYFDQAGIKFFNGRPKQNGSGSFIDDDGPVDVSEDGFINTGIFVNTVWGPWNKVAKYYKATANFDYIAVGLFNGSDGSIQIDGIRIIEVGSSECPEWNVLQNITFTDDVNIVYRSSYITAAGSNVKTSADVQGPVIVAPQSTVTLKSSNLVVMEDGFEVQDGGTFHAFIAPCDADCFPPLADAGPDRSICSPGTINIGNSAVANPESHYSWSAVPTTAMAYLSCNNCPNPTVDIGAITTFGQVKYTLTVSNPCGQTSDEMNLFYDLSWQSFSASVNAYNIQYNDYMEFDVTCDSHTEKVFIEIYNNSNNSLVYSKTLYRGVDFNTIPFHWKLDQYLTNCVDYTVKIRSQNFCNPTLSPIQTIPWIRNRTINVSSWPNVFTPPNPPNEKLCYNVIGAETYEIEVFASGVTLYYQTGQMFPGSNCLWDGILNNGNPASDGTYRVVVVFSNCVNTIGHEDYVTLFNDATSPSSAAKLATKIQEDPIAIVNKSYVIPNPNSGTFKIIFSEEFISNSNIEIYDNFGGIVYKNTTHHEREKILDFTDLAKGIYQLRVWNDSATYYTKIIIQ